ncbi:E3 ubiquitin-protein ligase BRE1-like [Haliotis rubra]|uniref:E3 ubiquitin-protein ligase BRE1-like n=1 Tax=Haliotis rubra TaxID=36100 RepID=UPI001EE6341E|nr:E3 ubiquitin-protein ligase BRE1-like [Haliotis rubra]XP_046546721.1 E3 ubiquitin-protein ligase BRE1-like [Haliotis rubra]XP_046546722.1 E3 ubiquitin-protein ligase BRE1-like [Haliotis rubra]XP_046546723.1 E3 ubiquitin-protein ligase BRE1-like [Haliotis rubra]
MAIRDRTTLMLFITILFLISVLSWGIPDASPYPFYKHGPEKQCLKQTFEKSERNDKTLGSTETCRTRLKRKGYTIEELAKQSKVMEERVARLEKRVHELEEDGEEAVSQPGHNTQNHKDITEDHPKKLEKLTNSVNRLDSTVSKLSDQMESLTNRVENIDVWKTDIVNLELPKIRQDAKDATRGVEGWLEKVDALVQDVGNISINVTSVNTTVSELAHNVTAVSARLADLDARERQIADTGDATRKMAEDAEKAAAENARNVQELSLEVESITTKMAGINSTMSTMDQAMKESTALLLSWRTEISEKELPMIKQNITDNRKLLEEARQNASESSRLLQGHILLAKDKYVEFHKHINEIHKREKEFMDENDSVKREVETLKNVSKVLGFDVANLQENVNSLQHLTESVRTQVFSNSEKLEAVTQSVGNITSNITAINITAEHLSSQLNVTKQSVESLASWRNELVLKEIPTLKQDIDVVHQEVEQVQRNTSTNGDLIKAHIVWANWTYVEFQKHRNATNKKVAEFAGKHDNTDRKLDGEELDGAMTKAELSQLKGKSAYHDISFLLTVLNTIVSVFLMMYAWKTLSSASLPAPAAPAVTTSCNDIQERGFRREEKYELSWTGPMEDSLCIVTFHTETEMKHADQTRSVFESVQQPCPTIHTRVIRCHADIKQLPGSRVFLVFVDFNERHVILEDPTKGLGDLRVTTVRSLWRFGADVTVIYCGDRGSVNLGSGLFNPDLSSIHRQKELTQLQKSDRILSICSDFSNDQKEHCRTFINRLLRRQPTTSADYDFNNHE